MLTIKTTGSDLTFSVLVQPRASKNGVVGLHRDALKIRLTAPPVEGAANKQCIGLLAKALGVAKSRLSVAGGQTHRRKQIRISNVTETEMSAIKRRLMDLARPNH